MKKIFALFVLIVLFNSLSANGACLIDELNNNSKCTGGASPVITTDENVPQQNDIQSNKEDLIKMYQIPTISYPSNMKNGFPILNPSANCAFGMCQPR